ARANGGPRRLDRLVLDRRAAEPHLAERPIRVAHEEAGHERLVDALGAAPVVEPRGLGEELDRDPRVRERMPDEVHGRLPAVAGAAAEKLVLAQAPDSA